MEIISERKCRVALWHVRANRACSQIDSTYHPGAMELIADRDLSTSVAQNTMTMTRRYESTEMYPGKRRIVQASQSFP